MAHERGRGQSRVHRAAEETAALAVLLDRAERGDPAFALLGGEAGAGMTRLGGFSIT